jgi:hypothetical protein
MSYLVKAIKKLKPNAEFSFTDDDYSTVKWDVLDGEAPTKTELDVAIKEVKAEEIAEVKAKATQRQAILDRLGITAEEAALLLS